MSYTYVTMWPIVDDDLTVRQLADEALPDMRRLAAEAGAVIAGPVTYSVGLGPGGTAVLYGRAAAALAAGGDAVPIGRRTAGACGDAAGTERGYQRHRYQGDTKCRPCLDAHAADARGRAAARRANKSMEDAA